MYVYIYIYTTFPLHIVLIISALYLCMDEFPLYNIIMIICVLYVVLIDIDGSGKIGQLRSVPWRI